MARPNRLTLTLVLIVAAVLALGASSASSSSRGGGCVPAGGAKPCTGGSPPLAVCAVGGVLRPRACSAVDRARGGADFVLVTTHG